MKGSILNFQGKNSGPLSKSFSIRSSILNGSSILNEIKQTTSQRFFSFPNEFYLKIANQAILVQCPTSGFPTTLVRQLIKDYDNMQYFKLDPWSPWGLLSYSQSDVLITSRSMFLKQYTFKTHTTVEKVIVESYEDRYFIALIELDVSGQRRELHTLGDNSYLQRAPDVCSNCFDTMKLYHANFQDVRAFTSNGLSIVVYNDMSMNFTGRSIEDHTISPLPRSLPLPPIQGIRSMALLAQNLFVVSSNGKLVYVKGLNENNTLTFEANDWRTVDFSRDIDKVKCHGINCMFLAFTGEIYGLGTFPKFGVANYVLIYSDLVSHLASFHDQIYHMDIHEGSVSFSNVAKTKIYYYVEGTQCHTGPVGNVSEVLIEGTNRPLISFASIPRYERLFLATSKDILISDETGYLNITKHVDQGQIVSLTSGTHHTVALVQTSFNTTHLLTFSTQQVNVLGVDDGQTYTWYKVDVGIQIGHVLGHHFSTTFVDRAGTTIYHFSSRNNNDKLYPCNSMTTRTPFMCNLVSLPNATMDEQQRVILSEFSCATYFCLFVDASRYNVYMSGTSTEYQVGELITSATLKKLPLPSTKLLERVFTGDQASFLLFSGNELYAAGSNRFDRLGFAFDYLPYVQSYARVSLPLSLSESIIDLHVARHYTSFLSNTGQLYVMGWKIGPHFIVDSEMDLPIRYFFSRSYMTIYQPVLPLASCPIDYYNASLMCAPCHFMFECDGIHQMSPSLDDPHTIVGGHGVYTHKTCDGIPYHHSHVCHGHGSCIGFNQCQCDSMYSSRLSCSKIVCHGLPCQF